MISWGFRIVRCRLLVWRGLGRWGWRIGVRSWIGGILGIRILGCCSWSRFGTVASPLV